MTNMFDSVAAADEWERGARARNVALQAATDLMFERGGIGVGMRVLDVGAGTGDTSLRAAELTGPSGAVIATDIAAPMLAIAARRAGDAGFAHLTTAVMDTTALAVAPTTCDVVIARHSLQFAEPTAAALHAVHAALKPGGRFAAVVWGDAASNPYGWLPVAAARRANLLRADVDVLMRPYFLGDPVALAAAASSAGFVEVAVADVDGERIAPVMADAVRWATTGPLYRTVAAELDAGEVAVLRAAVIDALGAFVDGTGVRARTRMLVLSATR